MVFKLNPPELESDNISWLHKCIKHLINAGLDKIRFKNGIVIQPNDRVSIILENVNHVSPIHISFRQYNQLSAEIVLNRINTVLQSNQNFFFDDGLKIKIDHIVVPVGYGRNRLRGTSIESFTRQKHGLIHYNSENDNMCLAYALVLAVKHLENKTTELNRLKKSSSELQREAEILCDLANVNLSNGATIDHVNKFQDYYSDIFQLIIYNSRSGNSTMFVGRESPNTKKLYILHEDNHYAAIKSLTAAFSWSYFCSDCHTGYSNRLAHYKCKYSCPCCFGKPICDSNNTNINCNDCGRNFRGPTCFNQHLHGSKKNCHEFKKCNACCAVYIVNKNRQHNCNTKYCDSCKKFLPISHKCYMQKYVTKRKDETSNCYIFFDLECTQDKPLFDSNEKFAHTANLCVVNLVCSECFNEDDINIACHRCGIRQYIFFGDKCVEVFNTHF